MKEVIIGYFVIVNLIAFFLGLHDKRAAIKGKWRVPEGNLFLVSFIGGGCGMFLSMLLFRHKTKHIKFMVGIPLVILFNGYIFTRALQIYG